MKKMSVFGVMVVVAMCVLSAVSGRAEAQGKRTFDEAFDEVLISAGKTASPGVVAIDVKRKTAAPGPAPVPAREMRAFVRGAGPVTGVILTADGYIVTSLFNVEGDVESIKVTLPDGKEQDAEMLGSDRGRNIALLKVKAKGLPVLKVAKADEIHVGQWALALGRSYPGGSANVSLGIVSATNRIAGRAVQTDAAVGPANYGGALVDIEGRLIGILTPLTSSGPSDRAVEYRDSGIGFAVPVVDILAEMDRLKAGEVIQPAFLGIRFDSTQTTGGAQVVEILPGTGAEKAGLKAGDVITEFDGRTIKTTFQLLYAIGSRSSGDEVKFKVKRGEEIIEFTVTLGPRPEGT